MKSFSDGSSAVTSHNDASKLESVHERSQVFTFVGLLAQGHQNLLKVEHFCLFNTDDPT